MLNMCYNDTSNPIFFLPYPYTQNNKKEIVLTDKPLLNIYDTKLFQINCQIDMILEVTLFLKLFNMY